MKVSLLSKTTALPGYRKLYLCFSVSGNTLSRKVAKALQRASPLYVAGVEPKVSLYLGNPEEIKPEPILHAKVSDEKAAIKSGLSFYERLQAADPSYKFDCRCGCKFKVKNHYLRHIKKCSVLHSLRELFQRVNKSAMADQYGEKKKQKAKEARRARKAEKEAWNARLGKKSKSRKVRRPVKERQSKRTKRTKRT
jgi:hypothetical protein